MKETEEFISETIEVDLDNLRDELLKVPADLARFNSLHATAYAKLLNAKSRRERAHSELLLDIDMIAALAEELDKKPSLDQIKAAIVCHEDFEAAKDAEISAEIEVKRAIGRVDAIREKGRMIQMATALIRDELNAEDDLGN